MIIIPTEKRFDWAHAPIVLFFVVLVNILAFLLYQSSDDQKFQHGLTVYQQSQEFEFEWPLFEKYLTQQGDDDLLVEYQSLYRAAEYEHLSTVMLARLDFFEYLNSNYALHMSFDRYQRWLPQRQLAHKAVASMSYFAHGLTPSRFSVPALFTHQFLHGGVMHLLGNMFFLIICGFAVEAAVGHRLFLLFYLLSGVAGGLLHMAMNMDSTQPLVGASGAISGVMAMYLAIFRLKKIEFFYWFFVFVGYFRAPALLILPFYLGKEISSYYGEDGSNVAFMAHAGGFVCGAILIAAAIFLRPSVLNREYIETNQEIEPEQEELAKVYALIERFQFQHALKYMQAIIAQRGLTFERAFIRHNLSKLVAGPVHDKFLIEMFSLRGADSKDAEKLVEIWRDNGQISTQLDADNLIRLAMTFATFSNPKAAEDIFKNLHATKTQPEQLGILARKLSLAFAQLKDRNKKQHYAQLADALLAGGQ